MIVRECSRFPGAAKNANGFLACSFVSEAYVVHVEQRQFSSRVTFTDGESEDVIVARKVESADEARMFVERMADHLHKYAGLRSIQIVPPDPPP